MMKKFREPSCLNSFVSKCSPQKISWKPTRSIAIVFLSCVVIFLFSDARRISGRRLRGNNISWYLNQIADSTKFFESDTLRFFSPHLKFFDTDAQFNTWQKAIDSLKTYPNIEFGYFDRDEFKIEFNGKDTFLIKNATLSYYASRLDGKFSIDRKTKIMTLVFYTFDGTKGSDEINDWIKGSSIKYRIIEFTKSNLVLVKIKTE